MTPEMTTKPCPWCGRQPAYPNVGWREHEMTEHLHDAHPEMYVPADDPRDGDEMTSDDER